MCNRGKNASFRRGPAHFFNLNLSEVKLTKYWKSFTQIEELVPHEPVFVCARSVLSVCRSGFALFPDFGYALQTLNY
jgi:hypothetical protein